MIAVPILLIILAREVRLAWIELLLSCLRVLFLWYSCLILEMLVWILIWINVWRLKYVSEFLQLLLIIRIRINPRPVWDYYDLRNKCNLTVFVLSISWNAAYCLLRVIKSVISWTHSSSRLAFFTWRLPRECSSLWLYWEVPNSLYHSLYSFLIFISVVWKEGSASSKICALPNSKVIPESLFSKICQKNGLPFLLHVSLLWVEIRVLALWRVEAGGADIKILHILSKVLLVWLRRRDIIYELRNTAAYIFKVFQTSRRDLLVIFAVRALWSIILIILAYFGYPSVNVLSSLQVADWKVGCEKDLPYHDLLQTIYYNYTLTYLFDS